MFNGPKLIITYYFYLCVVALVSWAEMFNLARLEFCISAALEKLPRRDYWMFCPNPPTLLIFQWLPGTLIYSLFWGWVTSLCWSPSDNPLAYGHEAKNGILRDFKNKQCGYHVLLGRKPWNVYNYS